jgi:membrane protease YdiL (CAAX protease family)
VTADAQAPAPESESRFAAGLRGFGAPGLIAILLILAGALAFMPIAAALILIWVWLSKTPWRDVGLARPRSWIGGLIAGVVLGVGLKFAMKALVMPFLGAPPTNEAFHYLAGNRNAALEFAAYAVYGAGFSEELSFRGYLFERFKKLLGGGAGATLFTLVVVTALFGAAHWQQGPSAMINAAITGLALGIVFLACRRKLFVPMVMHAAFDLTALAMIYYNLESPISHLAFK